MCQLKLIGIGVLLSILCILLLVTTATQFLILHTLYIGNELFTFWVHISISMAPSLAVYIYLLYGITISGDITNPLLPFLIMWIDSKPYLTKTLSKRKPNKTKIYKYLNSYHNACYAIISYLFTVLIIMPIISTISQFLCMCLLIIWSIYNLYEYLTTNAPIILNNSYDILILPLLYITPNFFMYSAMLFTIPIDNESYLVFLMIIYWIIAILYMIIYVTFISSKHQPSDMIMLTELLLLFSTLYICLLINYNQHDILHTFSLIFLIITALLDGCLLKAVPIKQYIKFENECEIYDNKYGNDIPALQMNINNEKLYCLIHHTLYHTHNEKNGDKLIILKTKDSNTYENILQINKDEIHTIDSCECYELQYQFMKMSDDNKELHINHLLINHKFIEDNKYKQFEQICFNFYWSVSVIVGIFPIIWLFYVLLLKQPNIIHITHYQDMFVLIIIGFYSLMLCVTCYTMYNDYEKYQIIAKLKQIYTNVTDQTNPNQLNKMCQKMLIGKEIINCFNQIDIAYIILLYMYGNTEFDEKNNEHVNEREWLEYEMDNLL